MAFEIFGSEAGSSATEDEATAASEDTTPDPASPLEPLPTEVLQNDMEQTSLEEPPSKPEEPPRTSECGLGLSVLNRHDIWNIDALKKREVKFTKDGNQRVKVLWPKFKNGKAVVRDVVVKQNFGYIDELFKVFINASENELANAREQLKGLCPPPMNLMLEKQPKDQAVAKHYARKLMKVPNVPPTSQGTGREASKIKQRQKPMCKKCSVTMKQHHCPFK
eukprot:gene15911-7244_t